MLTVLHLMVNEFVPDLSDCNTNRFSDPDIRAYSSPIFFLEVGLVRMYLSAGRKCYRAAVRILRPFPGSIRHVGHFQALR